MRNLIPAAKVLNQLMKFKLTGKKMPLILNLLVTNKCNFDCAYCYINPKTRRIADSTYAQIKSYIDQFYRIGTRSIWLQGGEPLLRNDIEKIVDYIKAKGMFCEIVNNGWLAEQKMTVLSRVDKVCFLLRVFKNYLSKEK